MTYVSPWDEISTRIFHELSLKRTASIPKSVIEKDFPNGSFMRKFGRKTQDIKDFIDLEVLGMGNGMINIFFSCVLMQLWSLVLRKTSSGFILNVSFNTKNFFFFLC